MPAKNLPVVGEAFLGSDPLAQKVIRIAFGFDTTDGVNDVIITDHVGDSDAYIAILTVSDTRFLITDLALRVVASFSAASPLAIGTDSSLVHFMSGVVWSSGQGGKAMRLGHTLAVAGQYVPILWQDSSPAIATNVIMSNPSWAYQNASYANVLPFPQTSVATMNISFPGDTLTNGDAELFVWYVEIP